MVYRCVTTRILLRLRVQLVVISRDSLYTEYRHSYTTYFTRPLVKTTITSTNVSLDLETNRSLSFEIFLHAIRLCRSCRKDRRYTYLYFYLTLCFPLYLTVYRLKTIFETQPRSKKYRQMAYRLTGKLTFDAVRVESVYGVRVIRVNDVNDIVTDVSLSLQLLRVVLRIGQHRTHVVHHFVSRVHRIITFVASHVACKRSQRNTYVRRRTSPPRDVGALKKNVYAPITTTTNQREKSSTIFSNDSYYLPSIETEISTVPFTSKPPRYLSQFFSSILSPTISRNLSKSGLPFSVNELRINVGIVFF